MERVFYERHNFASKDNPFIFNKACHLSSKYIASDLSANWHESIEVLYITGGSGYVTCDFVDCEVKEGEVFVINSDVLHSFKIKEGEEKLEYYFFIIGRDFCLYNGVDTDNIKFEGNVNNSETVDKFKRVIEAHSIEGEYKGVAIRSAALDLLFSLCTNHLKVQSKKADKKPLNLENVRSAIIYIRENISKKITINDLAVASGISEYYFIREFKRITHYTPVTYINMVRCDTAKRILAEGNYNVGEVADMCGFDNMPYFTKTFKRYTGLLPSEVKKK